MLGSPEARALTTRARTWVGLAAWYHSEHGTRMRALAAAEAEAEAEVQPGLLWSAAQAWQVLMLCSVHAASRKGRQHGQRRCVLDSVVCGASLTSSDALQELRREQERKAAWAANQVHFQKYREEQEKRTQERKRAEVRPGLCGPLCKRD